MEDYPAYLAIGIIVMLFFYFGYKDDYKRNPKEFILTLTGVILSIVSFVILNTYDTIIALIVGMGMLSGSILMKKKIQRNKK